MSFGGSLVSEGGFSKVKGFFNDIIGDFFTPRQQAEAITQGIAQPSQITGVKKKRW